MAHSSGTRLTRKETKERTHQELLAAAAKVFSKRGFAGASVEEIAEEAGYTTGALYAHFEGKEDLFLALLADIGAARIDSFSQSFSEDRDAWDAHTRLSRVFASIADGKPETTELQVEFWLYALRNPTVRPKLAHIWSERISQLESLVAQAMTQLCPTSKESVTEVTIATIALFQGLVRLRRLDPNLVPSTLFGRALYWMFAGLEESVSPPSRPPES